MSDHNEGVKVTGGNFNAHSVGGKGSTFIGGGDQIVGGLPWAGQLDALTTAVAAHDDREEVKAHLTSEAGAVAAELGKPEPDKQAVASRLKQISELVGGAGAVATAVVNLMAALI